MANEEKPTQDTLVTPDELIGYEEASASLGLAKGTMYALVHDGRIPHIRFGKRLVRFSRAALERWVSENSVPAAAVPCANGRDHQRKDK